jgi:hypothetical protein
MGILPLIVFGFVAIQAFATAGKATGWDAEGRGTYVSFNTYTGMERMIIRVAMSPVIFQLFIKFTTEITKPTEIKSI